MSNNNRLVTGKCHKCASIRNVVGSPPTCPKCLKHYKVNLHRRTLRQMKREGKEVGASSAADGGAIQPEFGRALGKSERGHNDFLNLVNDVWNKKAADGEQIDEA